MRSAIPGSPVSCAMCKHERDPHLVIAPGDPLDGGIMICQEETCECFATFSVHHGDLETSEHCGFCGGDHKPYRCPEVTSRADFRRWYNASSVTPVTPPPPVTQ